MKVRDLQEALDRWSPNSEFEVGVMNNPDYDETEYASRATPRRISAEPEKVVVLIQGSNTLRLN